MKTSVRLFVSCGILLCALALAAFAKQEPAPSDFRSEVSIQPASADAYLLTAKLTDLGSGKVDPALHTATYTVRVTREGRVASEHSASVAVQ